MHSHASQQWRQTVPLITPGVLQITLLIVRLLLQTSESCSTQFLSKPNTVFTKGTSLPEQLSPSGITIATCPCRHSRPQFLSLTPCVQTKCITPVPDLLRELCAHQLMKKALVTFPGQRKEASLHCIIQNSFFSMFPSLLIRLCNHFTVYANIKSPHCSPWSTLFCKLNSNKTRKKNQ